MFVVFVKSDLKGLVADPVKRDRPMEFLTVVRPVVEMFSHSTKLRMKLFSPHLCTPNRMKFWEHSNEFGSSYFTPLLKMCDLLCDRFAKVSGEGDVSLFEDDTFKVLEMSENWPQQDAVCSVQSNRRKSVSQS